VSYLFIAIVWVNHHHLLRFAEHATPQLIWWNFAHLFVVSLVPFSTAWIAVTRFAAVPVAVYAAIFVLVNSACLAFAWEVLAQAEVQEKVYDLPAIDRGYWYCPQGSSVSEIRGSRSILWLKYDCQGYQA
jgi:uncharacterized membrane protein